MQNSFKVSILLILIYMCIIGVEDFFTGNSQKSTDILLVGSFIYGLSITVFSLMGTAVAWFIFRKHLTFPFVCNIVFMSFIVSELPKTINTIL